MERGQENFDKISKMIKMEMERFDKSRINDFKNMFIKYLENHLNHQAQVISLGLVVSIVTVGFLVGQILGGFSSGSQSDCLTRGYL